MHRHRRFSAGAAACRTGRHGESPLEFSQPRWASLGLLPTAEASTRSSRRTSSSATIPVLLRLWCSVFSVLYFCSWFLTRTPHRSGSSCAGGHSMGYRRSERPQLRGSWPAGSEYGFVPSRNPAEFSWLSKFPAPADFTGNLNGFVRGFVSLAYPRHGAHKPIL